MINKNSPIPIYYQLEEYIKNEIEKGTMKPDQAIPSEREYSEMYNISRMTVRQALNNLVHEGYLYRHKGKGTFVEKQKVEQRLQGLTSFTEDMIERGLEPSSKLIHFEIITANKNISDKLELPENSPVYEIQRVRLADGTPMAFETTYLPANLVMDITEDIINHSLYKYIEDKLNLVIEEATQYLEASIAKDPEVKYLGLEKGSPILLISTTTYLSNGTPFEYVKAAYRADRYKFINQLKRTN